MNPTIFLHIGIGKTGTTAIQHFLNQNRETLKTYGLLYPNTGCVNTAHYELSRLLGFGPRLDKPVKISEQEKIEFIRLLESEIKKAKPQAILFSSEFFTNSKPVQGIKDFFESFNYSVKIIVYLRRHDTWWESLFNQATKTTTLPPWEFNLEKYIQFQKKRHAHASNYRQLLKKWAEVFGKENIIVRPYETQQNQPNIVADLLTHIGFEQAANELAQSLEWTNQSLSFFDLSLINAYQRANIDSELRQQFIHYILRNPHEENKTISIASPALRKRLIEGNMLHYKNIARQYLGRKNGQLFYDPLPNLEEEWQAPKPLTTSIIAEQTIYIMQILQSKKNTKKYWLW